MFSKEKIKRFFSIFHSLEISWQIYTVTLAYIIIMTIAMINDWKTGILLLLLLLIVLAFLYFNMETFVQNINALANDLSKEIREAHEDSYNRSPLGILFYDDKQRIRWLNTSMQNIIGKKDVLGEYIPEIDEQISQFFAVEDDKHWHIIKYYSKYYKTLHQKADGRLFLIDVSDEVNIQEQRKNDRLVFGYLLLDDYNEVIETLDDQEAADFDATLLKEINYWTNTYHIYSKRIDDEKFILLMNLATLAELEQNKFKFFDELKKKNNLQNILVSVSIGIAYPSKEEVDYRINDLAKQAQANLDLALGRGGDQIVVKSQYDKARFYGGKTQQTQKRSNIRSKLIFQAFQTQIQQCDNVLITGHQVPDLDSIGSALGMYKIVKLFNRPVKIVVNEDEFNSDVKELIRLSKNLNVNETFVDVEAAKALISKKTLIIMVDHNKPSLSDAEELIDMAEVVIVDHHRRGEEFPSNSVLTYIEPYASSTSELVTEFFMNMRYSKEGLSAFEATALLAGIMIDTHSFSSRTGSKTFDTASFLKSRGADMDQIQILMKEDYAAVSMRNRLIEKMEVFDHFAITKGDNQTIIDNIIASQTADSMLTIKGIDASFVVYRRNDHTIGISARSLGTVNVQIIMEKLGGGGHLSNAATQIEDINIDQAYQKLIEEIKIFKEDK
ncbi:DHH family phosphoesterase [Ignavigranum ruoffiae]|uniref:DHH family phosphoesterase n=1 Tax=Ignavigranum ruoffiae TaxID=89093 RepID=UPI0024AD1434|nr:DHH family phosphoesterase [Ignavigranum ruoffiae]